MYNSPKYSFEQWCLDNNRSDLLDRWDYNKNNFLPSEVAYKSEKNIWFKCPGGGHESEQHRIDNLANGRNKTIYCNKCRSFAQHFIDKFGEDLLNKIWNDSNPKSPWDYTYSSDKKAKFNCLNNSNHVFERFLEIYLNRTQECPYCAKEANSYAIKYPSSINYWSELNEKTPYDYSSCAHGNVFWKCNNGIHDDYKRTLKTSATNNFECPFCSEIVSGSSSHNIIDLTGKIFGDLTVIKYVKNNEEDKTTYANWLCKCSCGNDAIVNGYHLRTNHVTTCGNKELHFSGDKNPNWKGGITQDNVLIRMSSDYKKWRENTFINDNFTCQCCGTHGSDLNAHHLKDFASHEELRFDINNSITLCVSCHDVTILGSFHNLYGTHGKTEQELEEYINNKRKQLGINIPFSIDEYKNGKILKPDDIKNNSLETWIFDIYAPSELRTKNGFIKIQSANNVKEE